MPDFELSKPVVTQRFDHPLITLNSHPMVGNNLNGPSLIRVPDWAENRLGQFYMYFAHHTGTSIRLAVADALTGPWRVVNEPPLRLQATGFAQESVVWHQADGTAVHECPHIASPDVHVVEETREIVMLYHGLHSDGRQCTRIATSRDGLSFQAPKDDIDLAPPYLRLCPVGDHVIGIAWGGAIFTSASLFGPFEQGPRLMERPNGPGLIPRHPALHWRSGTLHTFYTLIGDCPERVWHLPITLGATPYDLQPGEPNVVVEPEFAWEGADLPPAPSRVGIAAKRERALRDPCVFEDHIFYAAGGESALAVAALRWQ